MKRLIVNADDFGFTRGVNRAIVRAFNTGIVTSATIMANGEAFADAIALARVNPGLGVGCHLTIVGGRSLAPAAGVSSLVDSGGLLPATLSKLMIKLGRGSVTTPDMAREFRAQVARVLECGVKPTHLDTHKHSHTHPMVMEALALVAAEFGINHIRNPFENTFRISRVGSTHKWAYLKQSVMAAAVSPGAILFKQLTEEYGLKTPDRFLGVKLTGMLDSAAIRSMMESLRQGTAELMCHPGEYDDDLELARTRLKRERELEFQAVSDPSLRQFAKQLGIELINYREL